MKQRLNRWMLAALPAVGLATIGAAAAPQGTTATTRLYGAPGQPNLSGVWTPSMMGAPPGLGGPAAKPSPRPPGSAMKPPTWGADPAPLTPDYAAKYQKILDAVAAGKPLADTASECKALGVPYVEFGPDPMEIIETPGQITMIQETGHEVRRIYTDGRKPDPNADPWFDGHSIGHWEGKMLVVDVTTLRGETPMDASDTPHSDALHVVEHFTLVKPNVIRIDSVATDPKAFTKPWTATHWWTRAPADYEVLEDVCGDNNRNQANPDGSQGVTLSK